MRRPDQGGNRGGIDPATVERIAGDYGIDRDSLSDKLAWLAWSIPMLTELKLNEPDADDVKRSYITPMHNAATMLHEKITGIPKDSSFHAELFHGYNKLYQLDTELEKLIDVLESIDPAGWKEKGGIVGHNSLIQQLAKFWKSQKGMSPTGSEKPGQFIAFMTECADALGFESSPLPARFARLRRKLKGTEFEL